MYNFVTLLLKTLQWFPITLRVKMKVLGMTYEASLVLNFACFSSLI